MAKEVIMPALGMAQETGTLLAWHKQPGDAVVKGEPLMTVAIFTLFLGRLGGLSAGVENYALFVLAGVLPWTFFSNVVTTAGGSVLANQHVVTKVYFPRLIVPLSGATACLFDFLITCGVMAAMIAWYGVVPGWGLALAPVIVLLLMVGLAWRGYRARQLATAKPKNAAQAAA